MGGRIGQVDGVFDVAVRAIRTAVGAGFRVTTNTTLFNSSKPEPVREMFDALMELGVEGVLLNTGIAGAREPVRMAHAMRLALEAGRHSYLAGRIQKKLYATASSPEKDF